MAGIKTVRGYLLAFFALAVVLAGGLSRVAPPVLSGDANGVMLALFLLSAGGLVLSVLIVARIFYVMAWGGRRESEDRLG